MQGVILSLSIRALIATFLLIGALQKARLNEKRILTIDDYLKKRIRQESGLAAYKDAR